MEKRVWKKAAAKPAKPVKGKPATARLTKRGESKLIPGSDFSPELENKTAAILTIDGRPKELKTTTALSLPGPLLIFDIDKRADPAIKRARKEWGKIVESCPLPIIRNIGTASDEAAQKMCREFLEVFHRNYELGLDAMANGVVGSIIIDDATELWDLILMANYGKMIRIIPRERQSANNEMREIVRKARSYRGNVAFVGKAKEIWVDDKPTGKWARAGFKELTGLVDSSLFVELKKQRAGTMVHQITVTNCGEDRTLNGRVFMEDEWEGFQPLPYVLSEIYGNTPMQWEDLDGDAGGTADEDEE